MRPHNWRPFFRGDAKRHASSNNLTYKLRSQHLIFTHCGCCTKEGIVRLLLLNLFLTTITHAPQSWVPHTSHRQVAVEFVRGSGEAFGQAASVVFGEAVL